jgi:hypothetical protein
MTIGNTSSCIPADSQYSIMASTSNTSWEITFNFFKFGYFSNEFEDTTIAEIASAYPSISLPSSVWNDTAAQLMVLGFVCSQGY